MSKFLDETGLNALWAKIKGLIPTSLPANGGNADTVDGLHANSFPYRSGVGYNRGGPYYKKIATANYKEITWGWRFLILDLYSNGYNQNTVYLGKFEISVGHWNATDKNVTVYSRWIWKSSNAYDCIVTVNDTSTYNIDVYAYNTMWDSPLSYVVIAYDGFVLSTNNAWGNLPEASDTVKIIDTTYLGYAGNSSTATKLQTARTLTVGSTGKSFDGSGNVSWNLSEIGAAASSHTHTKSQITDFPSSLKNPNALVMQANGTQVGSYDGSSAVTVNITPSNIGAATSGHDHTTLNTAFKFNNSDISEAAGNLTGTATAHTISFYRNGFTIPYQMDNANDGGMLRVRGTSESNTILELATWDDSGAGETIEFNYYPTTSRTTPTYSVVVPKKSGTIALTSDIPGVATTSANGLMSSTDKDNLDRSIYDVQDNQSGDTYKLDFYNNSGSTAAEIEIPVATTSAAGLMSKGDKANLDGAVKNITPSVTDSNVIIKMTKVNGNDSTVSIGSASTTSAGMMTASDKKLLSSLVSRVTALETKLKEYTK